MPSEFGMNCIAVAAVAGTLAFFAAMGWLAWQYLLPLL